MISNKIFVPLSYYIHLLLECEEVVHFVKLFYFVEVSEKDKRNLFMKISLHMFLLLIRWLWYDRKMKFVKGDHLPLLDKLHV